MRTRYVALAVGAAAWLACAWLWHAERAALLAAYLAAWWFWIGTMLGGLANVWLHNLTGGRWGEAIRVPLLAHAQPMWLAALLFLPIAFGLGELYPWAATAAGGMARWHHLLTAPGFKNLWLAPGFFLARSVFYLVVWCALARLSARPALRRSQPFSAAALIVYALTTGLASVDWIMSLTPLWYSSVFGMLQSTAQMMAGMALGTLFAVRAATPQVRRDLGNLLLMYVLSWAYLAFVQFLIIWSENLPHEIGWYLQRLHHGWTGMAHMLTLLLFCLPLLILLSRRAKEAPAVLGPLAGWLLAMLLCYAWWLVLPSVPPARHGWLWIAPWPALALAGVASLAYRAASRRVARRTEGETFHG